MKRSLRHSTTLLVVTLLAGLTAAGPIATAASAAAKPTYDIGYQGPLTGSSSQTGLNMVYAVELAINQANQKTSLPFHLKLVKYNDHGLPHTAIHVAQVAVKNKSVVALVGPALSADAALAEPYYAQAHLATVSPSATNSALAGSGWHNFFRVVADDAVQGPTDADYLVQTKGLKDLYVVNDGSAYGAGLAQTFAQEATKDGASVTSTIVPATSGCGNGGTASASQYPRAAENVMSSGAAAVFYGGYYCDLGLFVSALRAAGYTGVVMSGDASDTTALLKATDPSSAAAGVLLSCPCSQSDNPAFDADYQALAHFSAVTATYAPEAYDATNTIIAAISSLVAKKKAVTRANIVAALRKITYHGITKTIRFQSDGNVVGGQIYVNEVESGTIVQLGLA